LTRKIAAVTLSDRKEVSMPTLSDDEADALRGRYPRRCRECDEEVPKRYCERCDEYYEVGHREIVKAARALIEV